MVMEGSAQRITRRVKLFLSLDPPRVIEGGITLPSGKARLSDVVNDDRPFLLVQEPTTRPPEGWASELPPFILLNKQEVKAIAEID